MAWLNVRSLTVKDMHGTFVDANIWIYFIFKYDIAPSNDGVIA